VKGGGGNTSAKDAETLWVKPSGITLLELAPEKFVVMDRKKIAEMNSITPPVERTAREALVKEKMMAAVKPGCKGRPSVEAPLHNAFNKTYVVHTHPAIVNGMTCGRAGKAACARLFPEALWIEFTDPGYVLCTVVQKRIAEATAKSGREPNLVFLENHGVFVAGDSAADIRAGYKRVMETMLAEYKAKGMNTEFKTGPAPSAARVKEMHDKMKAFTGEKHAAFVAASGLFPVSHGPISPDHIAYMKSYAFFGEPTKEAVDVFVEKCGYPPRVIVAKDGVYAFMNTEKTAALALEFAQDGSEVMQLSEAFGGIQYMTDEARDFIDNWEVEAYRREVLK
jgi:rhamnose utilization protein RhaD (predicted bifunctional aldolase and dehydrogenase)